MKLWVDVPFGYLFGFPKLYEEGKDGDLTLWLRSQGCRGELSYVRMWEALDERKDIVRGIEEDT